MPRQGKPRLIHPACATSLSLANLSALAEVLFWHMVSHADDQGRLPGELRVLKAVTCPMREDINHGNIDLLLKELEHENVILRYNASNDPLIQICNWWEYQNPQWAYPSKSAPSEGWVDHLRYKKGGEVCVYNWPPAKAMGETTGEAIGEKAISTNEEIEQSLER